MINHTYNTNSSFSVVFQYLLGILLKCRHSPGLRGADLAWGPPLVTPRLTIGETHITHIIGRAGGVDDLQVNMPMLRATAVMVINQRLKMFQINDIFGEVRPSVRFVLAPGTMAGAGAEPGCHNVGGGDTEGSSGGGSPACTQHQGTGAPPGQVMVTIRVCFRVHIN